MEQLDLKASRVKFSAYRDETGVPHVRADSWLEAVYALGYLHALDRPTQMYFARAVASGRATERIANRPDLLEMDRFLRRAGIHRQLGDEVTRLPEGVLEQLEWYCRGVNDGFGEVGRTLPMWAVGFRPEPWDPEAVLLIGNLLSFAGLAIGEQETQRVMLELIQLGIEDERLRELFTPYLDGVDFAPLREVRMAKQLSDDALELLADLPRLAGSNAWAVAPSRSATGAALLASDPHLEVNRLPAIWYEVALQWKIGPGEMANPKGKEYAIGATLPGCPLMAVGRTSQLAWGVTYMHANTSDFFVEDVRPKMSTSEGAEEESIWQYRRGQEWFDYEPRTETILCRGEKPTEQKVYKNDVGTLTLEPDSAGKYLSVAWVGQREGSGQAIGAWLDVIASATAAEAMEAVKPSPHPSLVWIFADREGHIGKQASGWLSRRKRASGLVPLPAWDERNHWQGVIVPERLPSEYDPPQGFVASANEELYLADGAPLHSHGLHDYRRRRIDERLMELPQATIEEMQTLQYDVLSLHARDLLPVLLKHVEEGPLKEQLSAWDCRFTPESTEAVLFFRFYRRVLLEIFGQERGIGWQRMFYLATRIGYSAMVLTALDRMLPKVTSSWWRERSKREMIQRAADKAMAEPTQSWSQVNTFHFVNRFFGGKRGKGSATGRLLGFASSATPMRGCHATLFQGHLKATATRESTFAPSYHFVTDMGTDVAWTNLPGGPSENRFSKWYQTDINRWLEGEYKRLAAETS